MVGNGSAQSSTWSPSVPMQPVVDPAEWTRETLSDPDSFIYHFSSSEKSALIDAVRDVRRGSVALHKLSPGSFTVKGSLAQVLKDAHFELRRGKGVIMFRGFPVDELEREEAATGYIGIGTYFGSPMAQNMKGHILGHVKDLGGDYADPLTRGYFTRAEMRMHCDPCDYVGLLCLQTAKSGGESCIASSVTIYNRMLAERPDLVAELVKDLYRSKKGDVNPGEEAWFKQPVFTFFEGYFSAIGIGSAIDKAQGLPGVPPFTDAQFEAIEFYRRVAEDSIVDVPFQRGDIQFLNNYVTLHTRRAFEDWPEPERKRHLLRLWLFDENSRPVPPEQRNGYRGKGLSPAGVELNAPLDA